MPITKKQKHGRNLRAYHERRAAERAAQVDPHSTPAPASSHPSPTPPSQPEAPLHSPIVTPSTPALPNTPPISNRMPPLIEHVRAAIPLLEARVDPKRKSGVGHQKSKLPSLAVKDLSSVLELFRTYTSKDITWIQASIDTSRAKGHGLGHAETLRAWGRACLLDPTFIPRTSYGHSQHSLIDNDEFRAELEEHLRAAGKYVTANDIVQFTAQPATQESWGLTKPVARSTGQKWMHELDYRWGRERKGLYLDGHERPDVVQYRQNEFLPKWKALEARMRSFATYELPGFYTYMDPIIRRIVAWFHDECTFAAYDHRLLYWVLMSASPTPTRKGEGPTLMVSDLISADYGWLRSPDGKEWAREFFRAGASRDGYFSTEHVCRQIAHAADILAEHYPGEDHVFIFDNSPTHKKRGPDAPSAQRMPKFTPGPKKKNFLVETVDNEGNKIEVPMTGAYFSDGQPQSLYWPEGHPRAGWFKGMAQILKERGWENADKINAKCKKCDGERTDCCLRRILFNEPDFANPTSILECLVRSRGHGFLLLPKFHPELNPIEKCWGKAKRVFRELPEPRGEAQLRRNVEFALNSCVLEDFRKFCTLSRRICDGYSKGLDGRLSIWAAKIYHGHRLYPDKILEEVEDMLVKKEESRVETNM